MGLFSSIFGGSSQSSESGNKAYQKIQDYSAPLMDYTGQGAQGIASLLGGDASAYDKYKSAVGYDWDLGQGTNDVLAKRAAVGGLDSGATLRGLANYQTGLNNQYLNQYMTGLGSLADIGQNSANALINAGQYSKSKTTSTPGLLGAAASIASKVASGGF